MTRLNYADKVAEGASKRRDYNFRPRKTPAPDFQGEYASKDPIEDLAGRHAAL